MQTFFLLLSSPRAFHIFPSNSRSQLVLYLAKKKKKKNQVGRGFSRIASGVIQYIRAVHYGKERGWEKRFERAEIY